VQGCIHLCTSAPWHLCTELPLEDQETLIELLPRRLVGPRREEIARHAAATLQAVREGRARYGSVEDLKHDLLTEP
jgi:hypothetical protein